MAFDPIKEGAVEVFDPAAEGAVEVIDAPPPPATTEEVTERASMVYDTAVEDEISLEQADMYFYPSAAADPTDPFPPTPPPDNRIGFSEEFKNQWTGKNLITKIPITGGIVGAIESVKIIVIANRATDPNFDYDHFNRFRDEMARGRATGLFGIDRSGPPSAANRESDLKFIAGVIKDFEKQQRGRTFGGKVAAGVSQLPTWMVEFMATGGLASLGDDVAKKAGEKLLRKYVKTAAGKAVLKTSRLATGAVVRTSTGLLPRVGEKAVNRQELISLGIAEEEGWATSLAKAWGDVAIESFSEETGGVLTKGAGKLLSKLPFGQRFITTLQNKWVALGFGTSDDFASKVFTKAGYSNILGEMGEERIGTLLREATGVSDRKGGFGERVWNGMKEDFKLENLGVELVTLLTPAAAKRGMTIGQSLTQGVDVPSEAEQLDMVAKVGEVGFDSMEDAEAYAARAKEVAEREGKDFSIQTDFTDNTVTVELTETPADIERIDVEVDASDLITTEGTPENETVDFFVERLKAGKEINPIILIETPAGDLIVRDGHHRLAAARQVGSKTIPAIVQRFVPTTDAEMAKIEAGATKKAQEDKEFIKRIQEQAPPSAEEIKAFEGFADKSPAEQERITKKFREIRAKEAKPVRVVPPIIKEKQALSPTQSVTEVQKEKLGADPIDKVREALKQGKKIIPAIKTEQKAERAKRFGKARTELDRLTQGGMPVKEAIARSTGLLRGELTEYRQRFDSIADQLTDQETNALYAKIQNHKGITFPEILNVEKALEKLLAGSAITDGDVKNIEMVFGESFVDESGVDLLAGRQEVSSLYDRVVTIWKAGLLTGLKTTNLNTLSNLSHSMTETAKDIPAALVDKTAALFTGKRTLAFTTKGTKEGVIKGLKDGWKYLKTGHSERDIGKKLDYTKVNFGTGKLAKGLQAYEETIFHLLGAEDQPFYYGAKARSIASQAIAQGKTLGLKGNALDKHVDALIQNPTDDMLVAAVHDAEVAVFQNRTVLGDIAKGIQNLPGGEIIVPFGRTPSAVATQIIHYSPVGIVSEVAGQIKKGEFNQRKFSQAFGRSIVGTGVLFIGGELLKAGLLTLDFPKDEKERKLWELEGRKPNSIKIGGKWRSIQVLGPIGNGLVIGGHFTNELNKQGSPTKAIATAMGKSAKSFTEQTFTTGIKKAVDALTDPERSADEWFESMAGSMVPTIVADIARASVDKEVRQDGAIQRIQSRIPGLRGKLPNKVDVFGQDLPRYGGNVLEVMLDPSRPAKIRNDVVVDELRRLADKDIRVTPTLLGGKDGFDILTDEENTEMWRMNGDLVYRSLQSIITSRAYPLLASDFQRKKQIEQVVQLTRKAARFKMVGIKLRQGFAIEELIESGLMSSNETLEMIELLGK
jgi:ParB-like chromosome segregation protein Spo0J